MGFAENTVPIFGKMTVIIQEMSRQPFDRDTFNQ